MRLQLVEMRGSGDLDHAFRAVIDGGCDALYVVSSRHTVLNIRQLSTLRREINFRSPAAGELGRAPVDFSPTARTSTT